MTTLFADIIIPLPLPQLFTYRIPTIYNEVAQERARVVVQFGKNKLYSGLIAKIHSTAPEHYQAKYIEEVIDSEPIVTEEQLNFWAWIAEYYMCTIGEVYNAALPSGLKLSSETIILPHPDFDGDFRVLNDKEFLVAEALSSSENLTLKEISDILSIKTIMPIINSLIKKKVAIAEEDLKLKFKPKIEEYVRLTKQCRSEDVLRLKFDDLTNAPKQLELLLHYIKLSKWHSEQPREVKKVVLYKQADSSLAQLKGLIQKEILEIYEKEEGRLSPFLKEELITPPLNEFQLKATSEIEEGFKQKDVALLHGITSSGKTEIYLNLINKELAKGKTVLYLVPEIALTTQLVNRIKKRLGKVLGVYHSKFNENERVEIWNNTLNQSGYKVLIGARSTLLLPITNVGLVIVDEEHETSYKQHEPSPRYNARDAAIVFAKHQGAKVLLGSATPSMESYLNATNGKYAYVQLNKRYGEMQLPEMVVANIAEAQKKKTLKSHLTPELFHAIGGALERKEQIILFKNRRGFSPFLKCNQCGWIPECKSCDISLTYHKYKNQLNCHYCGFASHVPQTCSACGSRELQMLGYGTEKIEEDLEILFPNNSIQRLDLDTTRSKNAYQKILMDFENGEIDILVGTQMVTKGLDFDNVSLVGVLNADDMLHYPDFRAFERAFQTLEQVSGRAGRKHKKGTVIIQTYDPNHTVIQQLIQHNYKGMIKEQLTHRLQFHYPPFTRLLRITVKNKVDSVCADHAKIIVHELKKNLKSEILGPEKPSISRIRNWYIQHILIKFNKNMNQPLEKVALKNCIENLYSEKLISNSRVNLDVDPY
ncbi:MAG: primosomal protein N' [Flavobacteriales bacterium]|nr:primosomal protein N' [Flavobacteriales bacterium]